MRRLAEFPLVAGGSVIVEVDEPGGAEGGIVRAARPGEAVVRAGQTLEAAVEKIKPIATAFITRLREGVQAPDEIEVEFGIKLSTEAGVVITSSGMEANFKVTLTWTRQAGEGQS